MLPGRQMPFYPPDRKRLKRKQVNFRLPVPMVQGLEETASKRKTSMTALIEDAVTLDAGLSPLLAGVWPEIKEFAFKQHLDIRDQLPEVLAALVKRGLEAKGKK